ncbi:STAS domain-containing protein [Aestuariibacter halophilus]|uniref:STAS domain-containing protein n=1 Tax=Fluctibacter halophilus TaxID=226011 RepID=A0ABS8G7D5_9ALTE|nr:STAS domain-containing protein [Aestuariibacter halophilus]MCC2616031.1 STAS domain-containing protein [Aestuariibacter halophilus]
MSKNKRDVPEQDRLGHDPLEWLDAPDEQGGDEPAETQASVVADADSGDEVGPSPPDELTNEAPQAELSNDDAGAQMAQPSLPPTLTVPVIEAVHRDWQAYLSHHNGDLKVDMREVTSIDSSGFQWLVALQKWIDEQGSTCRVFGVQGALREQLRMLGGEPWLACVEEADG